MKLALSFFYDDIEDKIGMAKLLAIPHAVTGAGGGLRPGEPYDFAPALHKFDLFRREGVPVAVVEGPTPLDKAKLGLTGRDEEIDTFRRLLRLLPEWGIDTVCYNWMPMVGWYRTLTDIPARGGSTVTGYRDEISRQEPATQYGAVDAARMWRNLEYFLKAVLPVAEECGVRLALHPDDPPVDSLRGIARIITSFGALKKATELVESPMNGVTLCQGSLVTSGADPLEAIAYFGKAKKLFFAHFRDVRGDKFHFDETWHDAGPTDMAACMRKYIEVGFDGCVRPDHVPTLPMESGAHPGYGSLGNLFAVGYMRGLLEACGGTEE